MKVGSAEVQGETNSNRWTERYNLLQERCKSRKERCNESNLNDEKSMEKDK